MFSPRRSTKAEEMRGPWRSLEDVGDWFRKLLDPIGSIRPAEFRAGLEEQALAAYLLPPNIPSRLSRLRSPITYRSGQ